MQVVCGERMRCRWRGGEGRGRGRGEGADGHLSESVNFQMFVRKRISMTQRAALSLKYLSNWNDEQKNDSSDSATTFP